jgi:Flp pilus assembly pilin Flp
MQIFVPVAALQPHLTDQALLPDSESKPRNRLSINALLLRSESGSTAVEYAVMLGAICSLLLTSVRALGNSSSATFNNLSAAISTSPDFTAPGSFKPAPDPPGGVSLPPGS